MANLIYNQLYLNIVLKRNKKKVNFFTRQFIDAMAPSNFAMTNPEVLRETVKTHGQNLVKGFNNLLRDIEEGDGQLRVKMTDPSAFEMGKNVASSPGKVILTRNSSGLANSETTSLACLLTKVPPGKRSRLPAAADMPRALSSFSE